MRPMSHRDYVYTPISDEKRERMRATQRRRLGIPKGHVRIYGVHVPEGAEQPLRYWASWVANKFNFAAATAFVLRASQHGWRIAKPSPDQGDNPIKVDWAVVAALKDEGMDNQEIASAFGASLPYFEQEARRRGLG